MSMKIAVLMSGGIDSSFAALYLKRQGFDIFGLFFLQLGEKKQKEDLKKAQKVAESLSIPLFTVNAKIIFEKEIISYFCESFKQGITPNPCPFCNKKIKFGAVLKKAQSLGAEKIATGQYVRLREENSNYKLYKAKDSNKDQSYFLWQLAQKELRKTIFPLGDFTKKEVRQEVKKSPIAKFFTPSEDDQNYIESQDICFLKGKNLSGFLKERFKTKIAPIINKNGDIVGKHYGVHFFTIGQRSGIKIGAKTPTQKPLYVIKIESKKNTVIVGDEEDLYKKELIAKEVNWISGEPSKLPLTVQAQIRYRSKPASAIIKKFSKNLYRIEFKSPQRAITPGQHVVFYKKNLLLGGGVIKTSGDFKS